LKASDISPTDSTAILGEAAPKGSRGGSLGEGLRRFDRGTAWILNLFAKLAILLVLLQILSQFFVMVSKVIDAIASRTNVAYKVFNAMNSFASATVILSLMGGGVLCLLDLIQLLLMALSGAIRFLATGKFDNPESPYFVNYRFQSLLWKLPMAWVGLFYLNVLHWFYLDMTAPYIGGTSHQYQPHLNMRWPFPDGHHGPWDTTSEEVRQLIAEQRDWDSGISANK
jgi:hypothetical protein